MGGKRIIYSVVICHKVETWFTGLLHTFNSNSSKCQKISVRYTISFKWQRKRSCHQPSYQYRDCRFPRQQRHGMCARGTGHDPVILAYFGPARCLNLWTPWPCPEPQTEQLDQKYYAQLGKDSTAVGKTVLSTIIALKAWALLLCCVHYPWRISLLLSVGGAPSIQLCCRDSN